MDCDVNDNSIKKVHIEPLIFGKRQFRAPFKVDFTLWCPRVELLIIASKKGDIVLKRNGWKKCWRISVADHMDRLGGFEVDANRTLECISWGPSSDIIAIGMSDGHIYLIHADNGNIFWKKLITDKNGSRIKITKLHWSRECYRNVSWSYPESIWDPLQSSENTPWVSGLRFIEDIYRTRLEGSYLFVCRDDLKISVLAGAVLTVGVIDLTQLLEPLGISPFVLYDVKHNTWKGTLQIGVTSYGPRPITTGKDRVLTAPIKGESEPCLQTHLLNVPLDIPNFIWRMAARYICLYNRWIHVEENFQKILKDWQTQKQIFINRLIPSAKNLNLGACLVSFCLHGRGTPLGEAYVDRAISHNFQGLLEFLHNTFNTLVGALNGEFSEAVRTMCFQLEAFTTDIDSHFYSTIQLPLQYTEAYRKNLRDLSNFMSTTSFSFQRSVNITVKACVFNIDILLEFIKWLSVLPPVDRSGKKKQILCGQLSKMNISRELKFLIETFIEEEEMTTKLKENIFDIDGIMEKERKLENDGYYIRKEKEDRKNRTPEKIKEGLEKAKEVLMRTHGAKNDVAEDGTPIREKTTQFMKPNWFDRNNTAHWQEKLDKVSELWTTESDVSLETLANLGLRDEKQSTLPNLKKQCKIVKDILYKMDDNFQETLRIDSINWMCELGYGSKHQGYTQVDISLYHIADASSATYDLFEDEIGDLEDYVIAVAHDRKVGHIWCITSSDNKEGLSQPKSQYYMREELGVSIDVEVPLCVHEKDVNINNESSVEMEQKQIRISEIVYMGVQQEPFIHVLVNSKLDDGGNVRRLLKCQLGNQILAKHHDLTFRHDQFETLSLMFGDIHACFTSDESTRVNLFHTTPKSDDLFDIKIPQKNTIPLIEESIPNDENVLIDPNRSIFKEEV